MINPRTSDNRSLVHGGVIVQRSWTVGPSSFSSFSPAALVFIGVFSGVRRSAQRRIVETLDGALAAAVVAEVDGSATDGLVDRVAAAVVGEVDGGARRARAGFAVVVVNVGRAPALPVARVCVKKETK